MDHHSLASAILTGQPRARIARALVNANEKQTKGRRTMKGTGSVGAPPVGSAPREQGPVVDGPQEDVPVNVLGEDPGLLGAVMIVALLAWLAEYMARSTCTC